MAAEAHEVDNSECFIIGAGFSKAIHERFCTLSELSGTVWSKLKQKGKSLNKFEGSQFTEDIEIFLSNIAKDQPWLKNEDYFERKSIYEAALQTIVEEIESSVFEVFRDKKSELETNLNNWLCNLFRYWHRNQSTIITFNYDTLIERLFWAAADHSPERIGKSRP